MFDFFSKSALLVKLFCSLVSILIKGPFIPSVSVNAAMTLGVNGP